MRLITDDGKRSVDVGNYDEWHSLYSTIIVRTGRFVQKIPYAIDFLKEGVCEPHVCMETARQFNMVRDKLSNYGPEKAVFDIENLKLGVPWLDNLSPVVTSCANLYTTADGKDLLYEIVSILTYGSIMNTAVRAR